MNLSRTAVLFLPAILRLRRQEYWSILAGACGQFYGNHYTWQFAEGWKEHLDTPGSVQVGYLSRLFKARPWFRLVPDQAHKVVTSGYGNSVRGNVASSSYVTTAATPDGTLAISYLPAGGAITVNIGRFAGPVKVRWYDPSKGTYSVISKAPLRNSGSIRLSAPGANETATKIGCLSSRLRNRASCYGVLDANSRTPMPKPPCSQLSTNSVDGRFTYSAQKRATSPGHISTSLATGLVDSGTMS